MSERCVDFDKISTSILQSIYSGARYGLLHCKWITYPVQNCPEVWNKDKAYQSFLMEIFSSTSLAASLSGLTSYSGNEWRVGQFKEQFQELLYLKRTKRSVLLATLCSKDFKTKVRIIQLFSRIFGLKGFRQTKKYFSSSFTVVMRCLFISSSSKKSFSSLWKVSINGNLDAALKAFVLLPLPNVVNESHLEFTVESC